MGAIAFVQGKVGEVCGTEQDMGCCHELTAKASGLEGNKGYPYHFEGLRSLFVEAVARKSRLIWQSRQRSWVA